MKVETILNGVAVDQLMDTIDLLGKQPELGEFTFRANNNWIDGTFNRAENPNASGPAVDPDGRPNPHVHDIDEPPVLLGEDRGANPVEYLLVGLSGCVTTTFIAYAAAQGVRIDELRTELEGDIDVRAFLGITHDVRAGYKEIRISFHVKSDAPQSKIEELIALAKRRSPVAESISSGVPIEFTLASA